jgi:hypothetical protein
MGIGATFSLLESESLIEEGELTRAMGPSNNGSDVLAALDMLGWTLSTDRMKELRAGVREERTVAGGNPREVRFSSPTTPLICERALGFRSLNSTSNSGAFT